MVYNGIHGIHIYIRVVCKRNLIYINSYLYGYKLE